jgi:small-conductance mechanosensitive channel
MSFAERLLASVVHVGEALAERAPWIVMGLVFVVLSWWVSRVVVRVVRAALARTSTEGHVDLLIARTAGAVTFVVGVIVALGIMGIEVAALVTTLGLAGVTIGFALKDVLANSMAGVLLLLQRPFTFGDTILVDGYEGVVRDIRVRDTLIEQGNGCMVFVPNANVFNAAITNVSVNHRRRVDVQVRVPASADLEAARTAALSAVERLPGFDERVPVEALFVRCGTASVVLSVRRWVDTSSCPYARAQDAAIAAVYRALAEAGIEPATAE